jgi:DNA invertase Pin-like site-specific DNA recombinase
MQPIGYSYLRFSSGRQGKGDSIRRQSETTCAGEGPVSWCGRNKVTFDPSLSFKDAGKSAWKGNKQVRLQEFLSLIKSGRILPGSFLLVEKIDRLSRKGAIYGFDKCREILEGGVTIVDLSDDHRYSPSMLQGGLMNGVLELQIKLEQAEQYSRNLSARVAAARERDRARARKGILVTIWMPSWLTWEGEGEARRAVAIPEKVALVERIFREVIAGGFSQLLRRLKAENVPPLTGRGWSRSTLRRVISYRSVLGEYQPTKAGKPEGEVIENYYPRIIDEATYHQAQLSLSNRRLKTGGKGSVGLSGKAVFLFSGLVVDARDGRSTFVVGQKVEKRTPTRTPSRRAIIQSNGDYAVTFPLKVFERAILSQLKEIDPRDLFPPNRSGLDEVGNLERELQAVEARIKDFQGRLDGCEPTQTDYLLKALATNGKRREETAARLQEARMRLANPVAESWGEARTLIDYLDTAEDKEDARQRLRAALRRTISRILVLVVRRGTKQLVRARVEFVGLGEDRVWRDYFWIYQPPRANQGLPARLFAIYAPVRPLEEAFAVQGFDLTTPEGAEYARGCMERMPLEILDKEPHVRNWQTM